MGGETAVTVCNLKAPTNSEGQHCNIFRHQNGFQSTPHSELIMEQLGRNENPFTNFKEVSVSLNTESKMAFSRGEAIALWVGVVLFCAMLFCIFYRLCKVTVRTLIENMRPAEKKKKLNSQEKKVNKILSNQNA